MAMAALSSISREFGSPVSASWSAWAWICLSSSPFCSAVAAWSAMPVSLVLGVAVDERGSDEAEELTARHDRHDRDRAHAGGVEQVPFERISVVDRQEPGTGIGGDLSDRRAVRRGDGERLEHLRHRFGEPG
jgi:hypothetical protein